LGIAAPAMAAPYSQAINESGIGPFDDIQAFVSTPSTGLTLTNLSVGNWSETSHGPRWYEIGGPALSDITYDVNFDFDGTPFTYDFFAFDKGTMVDSARFTYNGSLSVADPASDPAGTFAADVASAVPEPGSIAILGLGLIGFGLICRRPRNGQYHA
jgi:hypothetical protein